MRERTPGVGSFLSSSRALPGAYYSDSGGVWRSIGPPPPTSPKFWKNLESDLEPTSFWNWEKENYFIF